MFPNGDYRNETKFFARRLDRIAGQLNTFLLVVVFGLGMLDLLYAIQKLVDSLPPPIIATAAP